MTATDWPCACNEATAENPRLNDGARYTVLLMQRAQFKGPEAIYFTGSQEAEKKKMRLSC